jgi:TatD DNase family protein
MVKFKEVIVFIDSHCHIDYIVDKNPDDSIENIITRAIDNGVERMLSVCIDLNQFPVLKDMADMYSNIDISVGIHPTDVDPKNIVTSSHLADLASSSSVVALGETGLDYFHKDVDIESQKSSFRSHIEASITINKPLIIHARDCFDDIFSILSDYKRVNGVMHCFTGSLDEAKAAIDLGFYISFSGIVTFKNAKELQETASNIPLDKILIETDSPYLAPMPFRGKINEPSYVRFVAEKLSALHGVTVKEIAEITTNNYYNLFKK